MKIVGFGDFLIHFSPVGNERFIQADSMKMSFTGAEANVCTALSYWGMDTSFVTSLPAHDLARHGLSSIRAHGVNTSHCATGTDRMGVYYLEIGASLRASGVIYDRMDTSFTKSGYSSYNWDEILKDADILYITGITPILSESLYDCCKKVLLKAKEQNVQVFYDVNYRPTLASFEKAGEILCEFAPYITTLIGNEEHLKMLLGIDSSYGEDETKKRLSDITEKARNILNIPTIAVTVRRTISASDAIIYASLSKGNEFAVSSQYKIHVVDRVGSGDAFSAGLIYSMCNGYDSQRAIEFAAASNAIKHTIVSDINFSSVSEIEKIIGANSRVDVSR